MERERGEGKTRDVWPPQACIHMNMYMGMCYMPTHTHTARPAVDCTMIYYCSTTRCLEEGDVKRLCCLVTTQLILLKDILWLWFTIFLML